MYPWRAEDLASSLTGVGHDEEPLPFVRSTDAASWKIVRLAGVVDSFQIVEYKVDPRPSVLACNLLRNEYSRSTGTDEAEPLRPEVALVGEAEALAGRRHALAGA
jgi:hypothetical protein